ncbi:MFS general substrate transporter [Acephala macrosclerotiorum]|nr:MFS general substrate transporter [Acephala macrosclerotiorum]
MSRHNSEDISSPNDTDLDLDPAELAAMKEERPSLYPTQSRVEPPVSLPREVCFVAIISMAQLMTQASLGQVIAPLYIIGDSFGTTNPGDLSWFPAAYSLTVGTFILIAGRLGDLYGHKRFFIVGFTWYGLWSLVAGFSVYSRSAIFFDICRAVQGIGPAFLLPNALAILGRTYPQGRRKEMVFSIFGATAPSGFLVGALFSSIFSQFVWWPWAFWVMGMICFVLAVAGHFAIPHMPSPKFEDDGTGMFTRIAGLGAISGISALVLINFAWNQGPNVGWSTPYVYVLLIVGFIFIGVFGFIESRARFPLIPMDALTKDTAFVLGCIATGWSSFGIWVFYLWQFLEELRGQSPLLCAVQFIPVAISGLAAALTTGVMLHKLGPRIVMMISMLAFTVGAILTATAPVKQAYWAQIFVSIIVMPWGMDMSFPASTILLSNHMHHDHQGVAASLVNTVVNYSVSIGLGFAGTVEGQVNHGGKDLLKGYRGAWYMEIGLASLGLGISIVYGLTQLREKRKDEEKTDTPGA